MYMDVKTFRVTCKPSKTVQYREICREKGQPDTIQLWSDCKYKYIQSPRLCHFEKIRVFGCCLKSYRSYRALK